MRMKERIYGFSIPESWKGRWEEKWRLIESGANQSAAESALLMGFDKVNAEKESWKEWADDRHALLAMAFKPEENDKQAGFSDYFGRSGMPAAVIFRKADGGEPEIRAAEDRLLELLSNPFIELPEQVKKERTTRHITSEQLTLIWDNPEFVPPDVENF